MGLRPLYIIDSLSAGIEFRCQNLTKVGPGAERVNKCKYKKYFIDESQKVIFNIEIFQSGCVC